MKKSTCLIYLLFICSLFCFNSCGMDVVYYLSAPVTAYNVHAITSANYSDTTSNYELSYFSFKTSELANKDFTEQDSNFRFDGTAVYYKIYNNYSTMNSDISSISSKISDTNESSAATYIVESLKYQQLKASNTNDVPLIKIDNVSSDRKVYIRLTNYHENENSLFSARILVGGDCENGVASDSTINLGTPRRASADALNFDFGRKYTSGKYNGSYVYPDKDDVDVKYSSTASAEGVWYVNMYAVGIGTDESYTTYYTNALHLGAVAISQNTEDN